MNRNSKVLIAVMWAVIVGWSLSSMASFVQQQREVQIQNEFNWSYQDGNAKRSE